ncbi:cytosine permease [Orbus mooreae]
MGNYAAIFLSASDYSRELKLGVSDVKRGFLYFIPILIAYGFVLTIGAMLAAVTGIVNPVEAFPLVIQNEYITVIVSIFIILGVIGVNMVANIVAPAYVISILTKLNYKPAVIITGLLAIASFPWLLVENDNAISLQLFIRIYSAFLGPIIAILLVDYYILSKQQVDIKALYQSDGQYAGVNKIAIIAMLIGAFFAFLEVNLT